MSDYKFKLIKRNVESDELDIKTDNVILITNNGQNFSNLYICLRAKSLDKDFIIHELYFNRYTNDESEDAHTGYLRGHFSLVDKTKLNEAIYCLRKTLNGEHMPNKHGTAWKEFKDQFFDWYIKSLKPVITAEIDLFQECLKVNNINK